MSEDHQPPGPGRPVGPGDCHDAVLWIFVAAGAGAAAAGMTGAAPAWAGAAAGAAAGFFAAVCSLARRVTR